MSNNPVAYISKDGVLFKELPPEGMNLTPLYKHPHPDNLGLALSIIDQKTLEIEELKAAVRSFFNDYLDQREESDSGRVFAPIAISNCRCMTLDPMSKLMTKMRELSGAKPPPKREE